MNSNNGLIPPHGGFRNLLSFQSAQFVYDATVLFCERFIDKKSRTHDQMVQAARSGVQNIAEGSTASATSKKTELKLTGVAKASLSELLLDYEDFLRHRNLQIWDKNSPQAISVREKYKTYKSNSSDPSYKINHYGLRTASAEEFANILICLINQASYLLGRQLQNLEHAFLNEGGFTEKLYRERQKKRYGDQK